MYLARRRINRKIHYFICESFPGSKGILSRDLMGLGTDPARYIVYPGGNSYYIDPCIEERLRQQGVKVDQNDLDTLFFEFLSPETRRVIEGFDRNYKRGSKQVTNQCGPAPHLFDKKRFHYLRFGGRTLRYIDRVPEKLFQPLLGKSRDELEQYFMSAERILRPGEHLNYIMSIFDMKRFIPDPDSDMSLIYQLDAVFIDRLCRLNNDSAFMLETKDNDDLHEHLVEYLIIYFDHEALRQPWDQDFIQDFINRHRAYRPPRKIQVKIREAEQLFGITWKELQQMDRSTLTRKYRRLALKHHPDQGGQSETFRRLTGYYKALLGRKRMR